MQNHQKAFAIFSFVLLVSMSNSLKSESCPRRFGPVSLFKKAIHAVGSGVSLGVRTFKHNLFIAKSGLRSNDSFASWRDSSYSCGR
ncbi:MAG: hypothetical protein QNJ31_06660 [Candidatus Caenarcaniphilales bacterium]|nr:hypothetical protein [Candidatus Caenarcaniphilales bacterium]